MTLVEVMLAVTILSGLFVVLDTVYVQSARRGQGTDENATAAAGAALVMEQILADTRCLAVEPKPAKTQADFKLSLDRHSISFFRSDAPAGAPGQPASAMPLAVVTLQLKRSPNGNYWLLRRYHHPDGTVEERTVAGAVLSDVSYEPLPAADGSLGCLRIWVTALSRDADLSLPPEVSPPPRHFTLSSIVGLRQSAGLAFSKGIPGFNPMANAGLVPHH